MATNGEAGPPSSGRGKRQELARWCHRAGLLSAVRHVRALARAEVRVLAYHRERELPGKARFEYDPPLVSASPQNFRAQMEYIRDRYHPISSTELIALVEQGREVPRNAVLVTFDDGYDDNYRIAFPILRELGVPATFFVSTGHIDSGLPYAYDWLVHMVCIASAPRLDVPEVDLHEALPASLAARQALAEELLDRIKWMEDAAQDAIITHLQNDWSMPRVPHPDCRPMTWDQLREMQAAGMDIGSHGVNHRMLARLPVHEMIAEVQDSQAALVRELGARPRTLSSPVGGPNAYSPAVIEAARAAGFRVAFNYISGSNRLPVADRFALQRLPVEYETDLGWFAGIVAWPELFSYPTRLRIG
jgi:peptidoglycan/xylan/chitin deacetylase (PgdA/CDA1 family)